MSDSALVGFGILGQNVGAGFRSRNIHEVAVLTANRLHRSVELGKHFLLVKLALDVPCQRTESRTRVCDVVADALILQLFELIGSCVELGVRHVTDSTGHTHATACNCTGSGFVECLLVVKVGEVFTLKPVLGCLPCQALRTFRSAFRQHVLANVLGDVAA